MAFRTLPVLVAFLSAPVQAPSSTAHFKRALALQDVARQYANASSYNLAEVEERTAMM